MTISNKSRSNFEKQYCCICGLLNCIESFDHQKISISQLKDKVNQIKKDLPQIDKLKVQVKRKFCHLKIQMAELLLKSQQKIIQKLNQQYFGHLRKRLKDISIFTDILQNKFNKLPNRSIVKNLKQLQKLKRQQAYSKNFQIDSIKQVINNFLKSTNIKKIVQNFDKQNCRIIQLLRKKASIDLSKSSKSVKSQTTTQNSSQKKIDIDRETYQWKYIRFTKNTKTVQLNNRNITDEDMIKKLPIISSFTNIKEFQIRNNKITSLSCNIISNNMKFLLVLDIRGNKVGDTGVSKIVTGLQNLRSLFVSETGITDLTGKIISENLPMLQTFWSQHTKLTGQSCLKICSKQKLRLLSLIGNPISEQQKEKIRVIFRSKGYLNI